MKLDELNARLLSRHTAESLSGGYGGDATSKGTFVIFRLAVTNKTHQPQMFDESQDQVVLLLGKDRYTEDFNAENGPDQSSFTWRSAEIQPDQTTTGEAVFDIPNDRLAELDTNGNLYVLNFSDADSYGRPSVLGTIRTYPPKS